jgi:integrase
MPSSSRGLTETAVKAAKPRAKPYKLTDERGLYLQVNPNGSLWWRFRFRFEGREQLLSLGVYPDVTLKAARKRRDEYRAQVADGVNPADERQAEKAAGANTFESVAREWFAKQAPNWADTHSLKIMARLEADLFPWLGRRPVASIEADELLRCLRRIENRGAIDTAHRAHQNAGQVFRYAVATGRAKRDPSGDLRGALPPVKQTHYPTITEPQKIGALLRAMDGYDGSVIVRSALRLAPLWFVRPGELRGALWREVNLEQAELRVGAERMKARVQHIVPLSRQSIEILQELHQHTGDSQFLFPGTRSWSRSISDNSVNAALRRMGYSKDEMTGHGFRSMASTILNEQGWNRDAIERQLAHGERNQVRAAYNYAEFLPERRKMMQAWADYLDGLKVGATIIPLQKAG